MKKYSASVVDRSRLWWRLRLGQALRTALACCMVAGATMFGPGRRVMTYPAFSYVTTILIVSDSTLGDAMRGFWHAGCATAHVIPPAVLSLYAIGPGSFTPGLAGAAVAAGAFLVALPDWSHLLAKRIAFGQLVIVYVGAVVHGHGGTDTGFLMHPLHVAASTGVGAVASVLAMLVPFPRLAHWEVKKASKLYAENASDRLDLYVEAITAQDSSVALDSISQAKPLSETATKILQTITDYKDAVLIERPNIRFWRPNRNEPGKNLQDMEMPIRGMEMALSSCPSFPVEMVNAELVDFIHSSKAQIHLKPEQAKCSAHLNTTTAPEYKTKFPEQTMIKNNVYVSAISYQDLPVMFFLFCMDLLREDSETHKTPDTKPEESRDSPSTQNWRTLLNLRFNSERMVFAVKCSISLGLAVLFGLIYNKKNGYWSGLTIAISFVTGRQPTFTVANARAQGTAMGSVYGIMCLFVLRNHVELRFVALVAWIVFSSFLRHSRMYGQAGAISAVIGALLILGRTEYGPPTQFAIARITEATIGLLCLILVEILLNPARAATLAKEELTQTLSALHECINQFHGKSEHDLSSELIEKQKKLKSHVVELEKFVTEAEQEPNFWFLPFNGACYRTLLVSLSTMTDILFFSVCLSRAWREEGDSKLRDDQKIFQEKVCATLKCLEEVSTVKSLHILDKMWQEKNKTRDVELGKSQNNLHAVIQEKEIQEVMSRFLQHSEEIANATEVGEVLRSKIVLNLSSIGFCINKLMRETIEIEKQVKELIKWENPSTRINLHEISCKVKSLYT